MEKVKSFVFYRSYYEAIEALDEADQVAVYDAICKYFFRGEETDLKGPAKAVFIPMVIAIESDFAYY